MWQRTRKLKGFSMVAHFTWLRMVKMNDLQDLLDLVLLPHLHMTHQV